MTKAWRIIIILLIFGILGYLREFLFVHLNVIMYHLYYGNEPVIPVPQIMKIFYIFSYDTLYYLKYVFTILWVCIFYFANYFALRIFSPNPLFTAILKYSYLIMFLLSAMSLGYGVFIHDRLQGDEYTVSRWLMGVAQSPVICLILIASEKLYRRSVSGSEQSL